MIEFSPGFAKDDYDCHSLQVENNVGKCEPVSRAVNASVMAVCKEVVLPFVSFGARHLSSRLMLTYSCVRDVMLKA